MIQITRVKKGITFNFLEKCMLNPAQEAYISAGRVNFEVQQIHHNPD
jgi:hypothetical protein